MATKKAPPKKKKENVFGGCRFEYYRPKAIGVNTKIIDFYLKFEEALELQIALQDCLLKLNRYNKARAEGSRQVMVISAHIKTNRINVLTSQLRKKERV